MVLDVGGNAHNQDLGWERSTQARTRWSTVNKGRGWSGARAVPRHALRALFGLPPAVQRQRAAKQGAGGMIVGHGEEELAAIAELSVAQPEVPGRHLHHQHVVIRVVCRLLDDARAELGKLSAADGFCHGLGCGCDEHGQDLGFKLSGGGWRFGLRDCERCFRRHPVLLLEDAASTVRSHRHVRPITTRAMFYPPHAGKRWKAALQLPVDLEWSRCTLLCDHNRCAFDCEVCGIFMHDLQPAVMQWCRDHLAAWRFLPQTCTMLFLNDNDRPLFRLRCF